MDYSVNNVALRDAIFSILVRAGTMAYRFASAAKIKLIADAQEQIIKFAQLQIDSNSSCLKNIRASIPNNPYVINYLPGAYDRHYSVDFIKHIVHPQADEEQKANLIYIVGKACIYHNTASEMLQALYKGIPIERSAQYQYWTVLVELEERESIPELRYNSDWLDLLEYIDDVVEDRNNRTWPVPAELQDKTLGSDYEKNGPIVSRIYQYLNLEIVY